MSIYRLLLTKICYFYFCLCFSFIFRHDLLNDVIVSLLETFWSSLYIALTCSWASWKYLSSSLANGFGVWSSVYRFFRLLLMNDNKSAAELIKGVIYSGQAGLTLRDIITVFTAIHSWNELVDVSISTQSPLLMHFSAGCFLYRTGRWSVWTAFGFAVTWRGGGGGHETFHYR